MRDATSRWNTGGSFCAQRLASTSAPTRSTVATWFISDLLRPDGGTVATMTTPGSFGTRSMSVEYTGTPKIASERALRLIARMRSWCTKFVSVPALRRIWSLYCAMPSEYSPTPYCSPMPLLHPHESITRLPASTRFVPSPLFHSTSSPVLQRVSGPVARQGSFDWRCFALWWYRASASYHAWCTVFARCRAVSVSSFSRAAWSSRISFAMASTFSRMTVVEFVTIGMLALKRSQYSPPCFSPVLPSNVTRFARAISPGVNLSAALCSPLDRLPSSMTLILPSARRASTSATAVSRGVENAIFVKKATRAKSELKWFANAKERPCVCRLSPVWSVPVIASISAFMFGQSSVAKPVRLTFRRSANCRIAGSRSANLPFERSITIFAYSPMWLQMTCAEGKPSFFAAWNVMSSAARSAPTLSTARRVTSSRPLKLISRRTRTVEASSTTQTSCHGGHYSNAREPSCS
mmetsp:Transcript_7598/g.26528  ORF Transcript_7598/g.26528 Transcript_7598/m.26528 type:complete len:465 (+) Transcript_7598:286-1680(+)